MGPAFLITQRLSQRGLISSFRRRESLQIQLSCHNQGALIAFDNHRIPPSRSLPLLPHLSNGVDIVLTRTCFSVCVPSQVLPGRSQESWCPGMPTARIAQGSAWGCQASPKVALLGFIHLPLDPLSTLCNLLPRRPTLTE